MVFGFGDHHKDEQDAYNSFYEGDGGQDYEGNKLHEGIAGAAAFYAMKKFEEKREAEGHQDHALAREMLAAVAGAEVDKLAERKGLDYEQRERAKEAARDRANQMYETNYGGGGGGDQSYDQQGGYQQQTNQGFGGDQGFGGAGGDSGYGAQSGGYQAGGDQGYGGQRGDYQAGGGGDYQGGGGNDYQGGGGGDYQGGGGYKAGGGYNRGGYDQQGGDY